MTEATVSGPPTTRSSFGRTFALVFSTVARHWKQCAVIVAAYAVLSSVVNAASRSSTDIIDPTTVAPSQAITAGVATLVALAILVLVNVFVAPVTLGALSLVGSAEVYGDAVETDSIIRRAFDRALEAIAVVLLTTILLLIGPVIVGLLGLAVALFTSAETGFAFLSFAVRAVMLLELYVFVRLALAIPIVMRERRGPIDSMRRSSELVRGAWWWTFGVVVVPLTIVAAYVVVTFVSFIGHDTARDFVVGGLTALIGTAVSATLYGVATGVAYATRAGEVVPPDVVEAERFDELEDQPPA